MGSGGTYRDDSNLDESVPYELWGKHLTSLVGEKALSSGEIHSRLACPLPKEKTQCLVRCFFQRS